MLGTHLIKRLLSNKPNLSSMHVISVLLMLVFHLSHTKETRPLSLRHPVTQVYPGLNRQQQLWLDELVFEQSGGLYA